MMTLLERLAAFKVAYEKWPASWPWLVREQDRDVLYGVWVIGNDYRNRSPLYGAYPPGFVDRVLALYPDVAELARRGERPLLHAFSGSVKAGPYLRLDLRRSRLARPELAGTVYDPPSYLHRAFRLVLADPPYGATDAERYATPPVDRRRALAGLAAVTAPGGHLAWLDHCWPMHSKAQWLTVGRILIQRSTNHRARVLSIFERVA